MKWKKSGNKKNAKDKKDEGGNDEEEEEDDEEDDEEEAEEGSDGKQEVGEGICSSGANYVNENGERIASVQ